MDSCAGASIFCNTEGALGKERVTDDYLEVSGIVRNGTSIETCVMIDTVFGPVHLSSDGCANILSYARVKDEASANGGAVCQDKCDDIFRVQMYKDGPLYEFHRKSGIYVLSRRNKLRAENGHKAKALIVTVAERKKAKHKIERAEQATELVIRLGYPSAATAAENLNTGQIVRCPLTSKDIVRAEKINGPAVASLKGKTKRH